jgi:hypothetical protein
MNRRTLLVRSCTVPLMGLVFMAGCGGGGEDTAPADEPNVGPGEPPGKPPGTKAASPSAPAEKKSSAPATK